MNNLIKILLLSSLTMFLQACEGTTPESEEDNLNPVISAINVEPRTVKIGEVAKITVNASDPEGGELSYTYSIQAGAINGIGCAVNWEAPNEDGKYKLSFGDYESAEFVTFVDGVKVRFFVDENENGQFDEGEQEVSPEGYSVTVQSKAKLYTYELREGLNFISLSIIICSSVSSRYFFFLSNSISVTFLSDNILNIRASSFFNSFS